MESSCLIFIAVCGKLLGIGLESSVVHVRWMDMLRACKGGQSMCCVPATGTDARTVWQNLPCHCPLLLLLVVISAVPACVGASSSYSPLNIISRSACASSRPWKMWLSFGVLCVEWEPRVGLLNQMWTSKKSVFLQPGSIGCEGTLRWLVQWKVIIHRGDKKSASVD